MPHKLPIWKEKTATLVLEELCSQNGVNMKYVDIVPTVKRLKFKLVSLSKRLKAPGKQGGRQLADLKKILSEQKFKLKLGGMKRKIQHELESETK